MVRVAGSLAHGGSTRPRRRSREARSRRCRAAPCASQVYAGIDPVSKKRHYLTETIPAGRKAAAEAEKVRTRLLAQVDDRRAAAHQRDRQPADGPLPGAARRRADHRRPVRELIRIHIRPLLGDLPVGRLDGEVLDIFSPSSAAAAPTATAAPCDRAPHRRASTTATSGAGRTSAGRSANGTLRKIHSILNDACKRAVRWRWLGTNPVAEAEPPPTTAARPAAADRRAGRAIVDDGLEGPGLGHARLAGDDRPAPAAASCARCAGTDVDLDAGVLTIRSSIAQTRRARPGRRTPRPTSAAGSPSTRQTLALLRAYRSTSRAAGCAARRRAGRRRLPLLRAIRTAATWLRPDTVTQRYAPHVRAARLGHAHPPAAPLLRHRAHRRRRRRPHRRRPPRPRRRRSDDAARLQRLGPRGRPARRQHDLRPPAGTAASAPASRPQQSHLGSLPSGRAEDQPAPTARSPPTSAPPSPAVRSSRATRFRPSPSSRPATA